MNVLKVQLSLGLLVSLAAWGQMTATTTIITSTLTQTSGPLGLGSTETLRVDLTNTATAVAPTNSATAASCTGSVSFLNSSGATIGTATPFTVAAGATSPVSLAFVNAGFTGNRGELRVVISLTRTSGVPCQLETSISTFDTSSGATHLFVSGPSMVIVPIGPIPRQPN
jgi:hypothetical protein